jgi:hypothetical protein
MAREFGHDCATPGTYRWLVAEGRLAFEIQDDPCPERRAILTSHDWQLVADGS